MNSNYAQWQSKLEAEAERKRQQFFGNIKSQPLTTPLGPILDAAGRVIKNEELRRTSLIPHPPES